MIAGPPCQPYSTTGWPAGLGCLTSSLASTCDSIRTSYARFWIGNVDTTLNVCTQGLDGSLRQAVEKLNALTPPPNVVQNVVDSTGNVPGWSWIQPPASLHHIPARDVRV